MASQTGKKRMTLSEHLALRAKAAEDAKAREQARLRRVDMLEALDQAVVCNCPACRGRAQAAHNSQGVLENRR